MKTLSGSDFVATGSLKDGSINVWSSGMGLNFAGGYNFTAKKNVVLNEDDSLVKVKLDINSLETAHEANGDSILVKKSLVGLNKKKIEDTSEDKPEEKKEVVSEKESIPAVVPQLSEEVDHDNELCGLFAEADDLMGATFAEDAQS